MVAVAIMFTRTRGPNGSVSSHLLQQEYAVLRPIAEPLRPEAARLVYADPIQSELAEVEKMFGEQMQSRYSYVDELVRYGCLLGGKRLRPILLLLVAKAVGRIENRHILLATVVEMIHTATLIHDDVLDMATMRRHCETVNHRWDTESSILLGDFLFTRAFYLASTLESTWACRLIGETTNRLCEGEIRQKGNQGDFGLSEEDYLQINDAKTASLCSCACRLGVTEHPDQAKLSAQVASFGSYLGQAFQIADDLLDVVGNESITGKSLGTDLRHQKATLPLIHLWGCLDSQQQQSLVEMLRQPGEEQLVRLLPMLEKHGSIEYARQRAIRFSQKAKGCLQGLPDNAATEMLQRLPGFVVDRVR